MTSIEALSFSSSVPDDNAVRISSISLINIVLASPSSCSERADIFSNIISSRSSLRLARSFRCSSASTRSKRNSLIALCNRPTSSFFEENQPRCNLCSLRSPSPIRSSAEIAPKIRLNEVEVTANISARINIAVPPKISIDSCSDFFSVVSSSL